MSIRFSIVVPVYNVEGYVRHCIESIIEQSYRDFELILVDDGSPDKSGTICDEFSVRDNRIVVVHKKNGGVVSARQTGLELAKGEYIVFVDGDDWVSEDFLEKMEKSINENSADLICCGYYIATNTHRIEKPISLRYGYYTKSDIVQEIFPRLIQMHDATYFPPSLWAKAIKRELILEEHSALDNNIKVGEDGACMIPTIYHSTTIALLSECLYYYRENQSSVTKSKRAFSWDNPKLIDQHIKKRININISDFKEQLYRKTAHELFTVAISQFNKHKKRKEIFEEIQENFKDPVYREAIQKCTFSGSFKAVIMNQALKRRWLSLMHLYSRIV